VSEAPTIIDWLQLAAPFVAAGLGIIAYGSQKKTDRREQVLSECRAIYVEYVAEAERLLLVMCKETDEDAVDQQTAKYREAFLALRIYASEPIVDLARPLLMEIVEFTEKDLDEPSHTEQITKIRKRIDGIVAAMRDDCFDAKTRENK